eukprot:1182410-Prorocentrum_minimum.AAC.8
MQQAGVEGVEEGGEGVVVARLGERAVTVAAVNGAPEEARRHALECRLRPKSRTQSAVRRRGPPGPGWEDRPPAAQAVNISSVHGSSRANNGKGALNTPDAVSCHKPHKPRRTPSRPPSDPFRIKRLEPFRRAAAVSRQVGRLASRLVTFPCPAATSSANNSGGEPSSPVAERLAKGLITLNYP